MTATVTAPPSADEATRLARLLNEGLRKAGAVPDYNEALWTSDAAALCKQEPVTEIEAVIRFATKDPWWKHKLYSFAFFAKHYGQLRTRAKGAGTLRPVGGQASQAAIQRRAAAYRRNMARAYEGLDGNGKPMWTYSERELDRVEAEYAATLRERWSA